jgi:hypothetical protein
VLPPGPLRIHVTHTAVLCVLCCARIMAAAAAAAAQQDDGTLVTLRCSSGGGGAQPSADLMPAELLSMCFGSLHSLRDLVSASATCCSWRAAAELDNEDGHALWMVAGIREFGPRLAACSLHRPWLAPPRLTPSSSLELAPALEDSEEHHDGGAAAAGEASFVGGGGDGNDSHHPLRNLLSASRGWQQAWTPAEFGRLREGFNTPRRGVISAPRTAAAWRSRCVAFAATLAVDPFQGGAARRTALHCAAAEAVAVAGRSRAAYSPLAHCRHVVTSGRWAVCSGCLRVLCDDCTNDVLLGAGTAHCAGCARLYCVACDYHGEVRFCDGCEVSFCRQCADVSLVCQGCEASMCSRCEVAGRVSACECAAAAADKDACDMDLGDSAGPHCCHSAQLVEGFLGMCEGVPPPSARQLLLFETSGVSAANGLQSVGGGKLSLSSSTAIVAPPPRQPERVPSEQNFSEGVDGDGGDRHTSTAAGLAHLNLGPSADAELQEAMAGLREFRTDPAMFRWGSIATVDNTCEFSYKSSIMGVVVCSAQVAAEFDMLVASLGASGDDHCMHAEAQPSIRWIGDVDSEYDEERQAAAQRAM